MSAHARLSCPTLVVALTFACHAAALAPPSAPGRATSSPGGATVRIQFLLPKGRYIAAEDRTVRVTLRNEGAGPVEFPDPFRDSDQSLTYTLTGPEHPDGYKVTWRSFVASDPGYTFDTDAPPRIRLGTGQTIESTVPLHEWMPLTRPGHYRLSARLTTEAFVAESSPFEFDIIPSAARSASLGMDVASPYGSGVMAAWLQEVDGAPLLMAGGYVDESDESPSGMRKGGATVLGPVEPGATEALFPWSNDPQGRSSVSWVVWRKGASLLAVAEPATTANPFRFDLGEPPERIVRPPLQTSAGELFIPVVGAGGKNLRLIRFQSSSDALEVTPGREVGRVILPGVPVAARATLQPASLGNGISVVLVEEGPGGLDLHHVRTTSTGRLTRVASTLLRGLRAVPQSEPGLWIDAAGRLNAALVAATLKNPRQAMLAEVRYRADGRLEAPPKLTSLALLPADARAAVARYHPEAQRNGALSWAILLEDGRVLHRRTFQGPMTPKNPVSVPLELFPGQDTWLLTLDPALGPTFEPLR
jgi:hypothetical protein